jgi:hypothetical protein
MIPLLVTLHNAEEALTFPRYLPRVAALLPSSVPAPTYPQMLVALGVATVIPILAAGWAHARPTSRTALWVLLLIQVVVLVNVVSHLVVATLVLHDYAPGLATALVLNLPFSVHLLRRAARERWVSRRALLALVPSALVVHGPVLIGLILLAGRVVRHE